MSLDPSYQPLYKQAQQLRYQVHGAFDNPNHPTAMVLSNEMHHLEHELQQRRNPRDIENRIKMIQHAMLEARTTPNSFMNSDHADYFHHSYENMRTTVRNFHDYS